MFLVGSPVLGVAQYDSLCLLIGCLDHSYLMWSLTWLCLGLSPCSLLSICTICSLFPFLFWILCNWMYLWFHLFSSVGLLTITLCFGILVVALGIYWIYLKSPWSCPELLPVLPVQWGTPPARQTCGKVCGAFLCSFPASALHGSQPAWLSFRFRL